MIRPSAIALVSMACLLIGFQPTFGADIGVDFLLQRGTSENLFGDSSNTFDAHTTSELEVSYYPISQVELSLSGSQTYYHDNTGLSNLLGQFRLTVVPLPESSPLLIQLQGSLDGIVYHTDFSSFDNNYADGNITLGYQLSPALIVRSGASIKSTTYINSETGHKRDVEFFAGGNVTLPGNNSLDLEAGFATTNFTHKDNVFFDDSLRPGDIIPTPYEDWFLKWVGQSESDLWTFYWSPRLSRPIGLKSGLSVAYTRRNFQNYDEELLLGFTTGYLSPWSSVWEGDNVTISLKSYFIPRTILQAGYGYWEKSYLKSIEADYYYYIDAKNDPARQDRQRRVFVYAQWPLLSAGGLYFEPNLKVDFTKNHSNKPLYEYSDYSVLIGVSVRL